LQAWPSGLAENTHEDWDKLMETHSYSPYFPINCYFSTQQVGVRVEQAE